MKLAEQLKRISFIHKLFRSAHNRRRLTGAMTKIGRVSIDYWDKVTNLGDQLPPLLAAHFTNCKCEHGPIRKGIKHFLSVGSVLALGSFDATVWGSGISDLEQLETVRFKATFRRFDLRAVRGPLTKIILQELGYNTTNVAIGDPAILAPVLYTPTCMPEKRFDVGVIYHWADFRKNDSPNLHSISIATDDLVSFVNELLQCKRIISSSLHGLILAEAYGIPATMLYSPQWGEGGLFKYLDYYYSTGRHSVVIAHTLQEALSIEPMPLPNCLESMRTDLIHSFPIDLWKN